MKTLIVYYSLTGNTDDTARKLASILSADLLRLEPEKAYPDKGLKKFLWGGRSAVMGEKPALTPCPFDGAAYDTIVFGTPVWAGTFAPPLRSFIAENRDALKDKRLAAFACSSGSSPGKTFEKLKKELGGIPFVSTLSLVDPKDQPKGSDGIKIAAFAAALAGESQ